MAGRMMLKRFDIITIFPDWVSGIERLGITGKAIAQGEVVLRVWNPRDFTTDAHRSVDDRPYGGGPGMVMRPEPLALAIEAAKADGASQTVSYLSPQGQCLNQNHVASLAERDSMLLLCGRYEGVDERLLEEFVDEEWSVGDYVLSGGEPAAVVLMDSIIRLLPNVLGHPQSAVQDSFSSGLLDHPHYTRPEVWRGHSVPEVLLGGDHSKVEAWRSARATERTHERRPDLLGSPAPSVGRQDEKTNK